MAKGAKEKTSMLWIYATVLYFTISPDPFHDHDTIPQMAYRNHLISHLKPKSSRHSIWCWVKFVFVDRPLLYWIVGVCHLIAPTPQFGIYGVRTINITKSKFVLQCFKITPSLLKFRHALIGKFLFETNVFQTCYLIFNEIDLWWLSLLYLIVVTSLSELRWSLIVVLWADMLFQILCCFYYCRLLNFVVM